MFGGDDDHLQARFAADPGPLARVKGRRIEEGGLLVPFTPLAIGEGIDAEMGKGDGLELLPGVLPWRGGHAGGPEHKGFHLRGRRDHLPGGSGNGEGKQQKKDDGSHELLWDGLKVMIVVVFLVVAKRMNPSSKPTRTGRPSLVVMRKGSPCQRMAQGPPLAE